MKNSTSLPGNVVSRFMCRHPIVSVYLSWATAVAVTTVVATAVQVATHKALTTNEDKYPKAPESSPIEELSNLRYFVLRSDSLTPSNLASASTPST